MAGPKFKVTSSDPCLHFVFRGSGDAVGAPTPPSGDVLSSGRPGILSKARQDSGRRSGGLEVQGQSSVHVGVEPSKANDLPAPSTEKNFTNDLKVPPTTPSFWATRQRPLLLEDIRARQRKLGGTDVYRINDSAKTVQGRQ